MALVKFDAEKAYKEKEGLRQDVHQLLDWLSKQPHLPELEEHHMIIFLHASNYRTEPTKKAIDNYYTLKTHFPEIFSNLNPMSAGLQQMFDVCALLNLPGKTPAGHRVFFSKLINPSVDVFVHVDQVKAFYMAVELALLRNGPSDGHVMVYDMEGFTFGHMLKFNLAVAKQATCFLQEALPVILKGIHVINVNPLIDKILAIFRPILDKSIYDMIFLHNKPDEQLYKTVPQKLLPNDYGGEAGTVSELQKHTKKIFEDNKDYFLKEETMRVDETKRVGKSIDLGTVFGVEGSFKKLNFD